MREAVAVRAAELSGHDQLRLAGRFVGAAAGDAMVVGARAEVRYDADQPYVLLSLELGPPPPARETWTTDDLFALRQEVRRRLDETGADDVEISYVGGASEGEFQEPPPARGKGAPVVTPDR